jgi:hypothetical protein
MAPETGVAAELLSRFGLPSMVLFSVVEVRL